MSSARPAAGAAGLSGPPVVHAPWTAAWWTGEPALGDLFGPAPSPAALKAVAERLAPTGPSAWMDDLERAPSAPIPPDALVVLAGQQPVLAGGAALVAHKAATAVRLAADLERAWGRRVVPVFLLASEDHDGTEVDHVDVINPSNGQLQRVRCRMTPGSDSFWRSQWDEGQLNAAIASVEATMAVWNGGKPAASIDGPLARRRSGFAGHVEALLHATFGPMGLVCLQAHRLTARATGVLDAALARHVDVHHTLDEGAQRLIALGLRVPFDPGDARPAVLESTAGRRRRLGPPGPDDPDGSAARRRLASDPTRHSPDASLRPIVQAAALPVVAQVVGPSELLYLGQARGLHALFGVIPPVLVPRLEATHLPARAMAGVPLEQALEAARRIVWNVARKDDLWSKQEDLIKLASELAQHASQGDPETARRARRWLAALEHSARRLAETPLWRGRLPAGLDTLLRPRGRPQDAVLAWLPIALASGDLAAWGRDLVERARPCDAPRHHLIAPPARVGTGPAG